MATNDGPLLPGARKEAPLDAAMRISIVCVGATAALFAVVALVGFGGGAGLGVALGGMLATVNLWLFAYVVRGVLAGGSRGRLWALVGALKFGALLFAAWLLLKSGHTSALALVFGYAALPAGLTVATFLRPPDEDAADTTATPEATADPNASAGEDSQHEELPPESSKKRQDSQD